MQRVTLIRDVLYRGENRKAGESFDADPLMVQEWRGHGFVREETPSEDGPPNEEPEETPSEDGPPEAEQASAPAPPGIVAGGTGAEGEMPGRIGRQSGKKQNG